jgi:hypothetical protein
VQIFFAYLAPEKWKPNSGVWHAVRTLDSSKFDGGKAEKLWISGYHESRVDLPSFELLSLLLETGAGVWDAFGGDWPAVGFFELCHFPNPGQKAKNLTNIVNPLP